MLILAYEYSSDNSIISLTRFSQNPNFLYYLISQQMIMIHSCQTFCLTCLHDLTETTEIFRLVIFTSPFPLHQSSSHPENEREKEVTGHWLRRSEYAKSKLTYLLNHSTLLPPKLPQEEPN